MHKFSNRLAMLMALNASVPRDYRVVNEAPGDAEIFLYDTIGYNWWDDSGVTAKQFTKDLKALGSKTLHLRVNSPGGDVFEGRAMVAALQAYPGKVIAHVDGLAASAASFLIMHADEVIMTEGSFMMIHNGWTFAMGDRHAMRETGDLLEQIDASIVDDYLTRTSESREDVGAMMDAETWLSAAAAVEKGFANSVAKGRDKEGTAANRDARRWNLSAYEHPPKALEPETTPAPTPEPASSPAPEPVECPAPQPDPAAEARMRALRMVETQHA